MTIFRKSFSPPQSLITDSFQLFPTDIEFYQTDFEAVMKSKEMLRIWGLSNWPEDSFTPEENKEDLKHHVQDNSDHAAYGYMIYSRDSKTCLGSLYVNPLPPVKENYHVSEIDKSLLDQFDARLDYWVTSGSGLESLITEGLITWFTETWNIRPLLSAREGLVERLEIYEELQLKKCLHLKSKTSGNLILYRT